MTETESYIRNPRRIHWERFSVLTENYLVGTLRKISNVNELEVTAGILTIVVQMAFENYVKIKRAKGKSLTTL